MGQVTAHPEAVAELHAAIAYYEDKSFGLGRRFLAEVDLFVDRIVANPRRFSPRVGDVHRANLKRFPFHINYLIEGETIAIIAFAHDKRRPLYWKDRLPKPGQPANWSPFSA